MGKKVLGLVVIGLLLTAAVSFAKGTTEPTAGTMKQLTIRVMTDTQGPPTKPPTEDVITPILREKTGVTAIPYPYPQALGDSAGAVVSALIAGNNLPDIFTHSYVPPQVDGQQALVDNDKVWDFNDIDFLKKMFPNFTSRISEYGDLKAWYDNEKTYAGTHIRITQEIDPKAFSTMMGQMNGTYYALKNGPLLDMYSQGLRDDVLKMIYPNARSDAEQRQWFMDSFDIYNPGDPWSDIPIKSMDDLENYLKKVKELIDSKNLMDAVGRDKMIPAQLNYDEGPPSIMWSNITMYGYQWVEPPFRVADKVYYNFQAPWVKGVLQWWNKLYNEGLLDPELFVKKRAQIHEEETRGRFAVFKNWGADVDDARKFAKDNGAAFGYRILGNNWPMVAKSQYDDASNDWVTYFQHFGANIITKNVKEEDLAQVCAWLDYHYSEEFDILRDWGPADFYTGTGNDRRYKPEYKDLENYQAYGIQGGKDGPYYGILYDSAATTPEGTFNWEIGIGHLTKYPYAPQYVYPFKKVEGMNYDAVTLSAVSAYQGQKLINLFPQIGWTNSELNNIKSFSKIQYLWFGIAGPFMAKAITDEPANFETNYAAYQKMFDNNGFNEGMADYQAKWTEIFNKYIKQYWR
jgi:hypothetical protein